MSILSPVWLIPIGLTFAYKLVLNISIRRTRCEIELGKPSNEDVGLYVLSMICQMGIFFFATILTWVVFFLALYVRSR